MSAIDCIKDRRGHPRVKMMDAMWDVSGSGVSSPENQYVLELDGVRISGSVDWDKSRHLEDEFYCWVSDKYYVLDSDRWVRKPDEPDVKWGPIVDPDESFVDDD